MKQYIQTWSCLNFTEEDTFMALDVMGKIFDCGIVAIMRAHSSDQLIAVSDAVLNGGINIIEVTMTTPGALEVVRQATNKYKDEVVFGMGSVLDAETARAAILAGAQFIVCPTLKVETIEICKRYSIPVIPGAYTPTEVLTAWEAGASLVKVFPASVGGPAYIKAIKAPLPQIRLSAVGGVDLANTASFIRSGAEVVGVGGELVSQKFVDDRDFKTIVERAILFREEVKKGRNL
jgi:2-dehydro-3-deoxyphosphogluconate aldolase/(4S)-4-hydroxy-2-oxoglutarate aldolase